MDRTADADLRLNACGETPKRSRKSRRNVTACRPSARARARTSSTAACPSTIECAARSILADGSRSSRCVLGSRRRNACRAVCRALSAVWPKPPTAVSNRIPYRTISSNRVEGGGARARRARVALCGCLWRVTRPVSGGICAWVSTSELLVSIVRASSGRRLAFCTRRESQEAAFPAKLISLDAVAPIARHLKVSKASHWRAPLDRADP